MNTLPLATLAEPALVTGGAGCFGGVLARYLVDRGVAVVTANRA